MDRASRAQAWRRAERALYDQPCPHIGCATDDCCTEDDPCDDRDGTELAADCDLCRTNLELDAMSAWS